MYSFYQNYLEGTQVARNPRNVPSRTDIVLFIGYQSFGPVGAKAAKHTGSQANLTVPRQVCTTTASTRMIHRWDDSPRSDAILRSPSHPQTLDKDTYAVTEGVELGLFRLDPEAFQLVLNVHLDGLRS